MTMSTCDAVSGNDSGPQLTIVQNIRVTFTSGGPGFGKYRVDANVVPPAGATGIPKATVNVLQNGTVITPVNAVVMTESPLGSRNFFVEQFSPAPSRGSQFWAEVAVDWIIQQRESGTSPVQTQP